MGTGVIFAIVVVAGLAYLVPWFVSRRHDEVDVEDSERFAQSMTIIRRSNGGLVDPEADGSEVSTPKTRRAAVNGVDQVYRRAVFRRRRILVALVFATLVATVVAITVSRVPWWAPVALGALTVGHVVWSAVSMKFILRVLDQRVETIKGGWVEETLSFQIPEDLRTDRKSQPEAETEPEGHEHSVELSVPIEPTGSLWEAIPVTTPTYVSTPLAPRTVRTIDLSAPSAMTAPAVPVTNETQVIEDVPEGQDELPLSERRRAVGE